MALQTNKNWRDICAQLQNLETCCVHEYVFGHSNKSSIILKHDVECKADRALNIALIEAEHGLKATYYFQASVLHDSPEDVVKIGELGHEVAYHYDVLDECEGDYVEAANLFSKTMAEFSKLGWPVTTVCPHGNPIKIRNGWNSNKDFFRNLQVRNKFPGIVDIVVDAEKIFGADFNYITDAGYSWYKVGSISENDKENIPDIRIEKLSVFLQEKDGPTVISSHPHRWHYSSSKAWIQRSTFFILRGVARKLAKNQFFERIMSKFYFLAKKV